MKSTHGYLTFTLGSVCLLHIPEHSRRNLPPCWFCTFQGNKCCGKWTEIKEDSLVIIASTTSYRQQVLSPE